MSRKNPKLLQFTVDGVKFQIDMSEFVVGASVFVPCVHPQKAANALKMACNRKGIQYALSTRIERDMLGIRLWRTA